MKDKTMDRQEVKKRRPGRRKRALAHYRGLLQIGKPVLCGICKTPIHWPATPILGALTVDHIKPRASYGRSRFDNLQPAHEKCNGHKGSTENYSPTELHKQRIIRAVELSRGRPIVYLQENKECGKVNFSSYLLAYKVYKRRSRSKGITRRQNIYKCLDCGAWHIGTPSKKREGRRLETEDY